MDLGKAGIGGQSSSFCGMRGTTSSTSTPTSSTITPSSTSTKISFLNTLKKRLSKMDLGKAGIGAHSSSFCGMRATTSSTSTPTSSTITPSSTSTEIPFLNTFKNRLSKMDLGKDGMGNRSCRLGEHIVEINAVEGSKQTRVSSMVFNVTDVKKPLVSAVKIVEAGNYIVMGPDGGYIEHIASGDKMCMRKDRGTFVLDVEFKNGETGVITVDSGAGVSAWPKEMLQDVPMGPKNEGLRMRAANGTPIANLGTKVIQFRGAEFQADFPRLV
jgi:hypothetical protein